MASLLANRLDAARHRRFVGRTPERELFQSVLTAVELPFFVLYVFGPGGVGKTTLLREFNHIAAQAQVPVTYLDGRNVDPAPDYFLSLLHQAMGLPASETLFHFLEKHSGRRVILLDTYETLAPLDGWLRDNFLPQLPGNVLVVLAGRNPPSLDWRTDLGWESIVHILPLRNLNPGESQAYLRKRQVPAGEHPAVLDFTHGHPLALSLVADVFAQRPSSHFQPQEAPNVIKTLLEQFVQKAPGPAHRAALEACALVRLTIESLLSAMLNTPDAHELFEWLRNLSFIDSEPHGLFPHDMAREALAADLRWRNPDWYAELHRRARTYYLKHLEQGDRRQQRRILFDYIFLHRDNPVVRPYFEWQESGSVFTDDIQPADAPALVAMVQRHEGQAAGRLAQHWLDRQPQGVSVLRDASGQAQGFLATVALEQVTAADREIDPALQAAWDTLRQQAPLRPGEVATYFRFWMSQDSYQAISPVQSRIFLNMVHHYLTTPALAYTLLACNDADFWADIFAYADLHRLPAADFEIEGRRYSVYGHDWRVVPPTAWLSLLAEREIALGTSPSATMAEPLVVLSQEDFARAVRDALHDFTDATGLRSNPLLQSRLIIEKAGSESSPTTRVVVLKEQLQTAAAALQQSPRQAKFFRALYHTYFQPAATQEQASEILDLPFSTYRRHLRAGVAHVTEHLWRQELGSLER